MINKYKEISWGEYLDQKDIHKYEEKGWIIINISKYSTYDPTSHKPTRFHYSIFMRKPIENCQTR